MTQEIAGIFPTIIILKHWWRKQVT